MADKDYMAGQMTALAIQSELQLRYMRSLFQALGVDPQTEEWIKDWDSFLSKTKEDKRLSASFKEGFEHIGERLLNLLRETS